ncbi:Peroxidase 44 [Nymphaea thermarum]|nr:Peroxidase 44 [Nymphaea thermarum]
MDRADTAGMVQANINSGSMWLHKFADAMVRMGKIEVLTGPHGQIRKSCRHLLLLNKKNGKWPDTDRLASIHNSHV